MVLNLAKKKDRFNINKKAKSETRARAQNEVTYSVIELDDLEPLVYD